MLKKFKKKKKEDILSSSNVILSSSKDNKMDRQDPHNKLRSQRGNFFDEKIKKKIEPADKIIDIYKIEGDLEDMTVLDQSNVGRWRFWGFLAVFFVLFIGVGFSFLSLYWFGTNSTAENNDVKFEIAADEEMTSGGDFVYVINYANLSDVSLKNASLNLRYPAGFNLSSAIPEPKEANNIWNLGDIRPNTSEQIKIRGRIIGEAEESKTITGVLTYTPENFSSEFQEIESSTSLVNATDLEFSFSGPDKSFVGETVEYILSYKSVSENDLGTIKFEFDLPDGFALLGSDPEPLEDEDTSWEIFGAFKEGEIKIQGIFSSYLEEDAKWKIRGFIKDDEESYYLQKEIENKTTILKSDALVGIVVNGTYDSKSVSLGETLNHKLSVKNESGAVFEDVVLKLVVKSKSDSLNWNTNIKDLDLVDWDSLKVPYDPLVKNIAPNKEEKDVFEVKVLKWTSEEFKELEEISPDEEKEINLAFNLNNPEALRNALDVYELGGYEIETYLEVEIGKTGGKKLSTSLRSNLIINKIHSDLSLDVEARYYDEAGVSLGKGPMPPQVNKETSYKIDWSLNNTVHELADVEVSVLLPEYIKWGEEQELSAGEFDYNFKTRVLKWKINRVPITANKLKASFEILLLPQEEHEGQILVLIPRAYVKAIDTRIKSEISISSGTLTTNLENDSYASAKGIVVEEVVEEAD